MSEHNERLAAREASLAEKVVRSTINQLVGNIKIADIDYRNYAHMPTRGQWPHRSASEVA